MVQWKTTILKNIDNAQLCESAKLLGNALCKTSTYLLFSYVGKVWLSVPCNAADWRYGSHRTDATGKVKKLNKFAILLILWKLAFISLLVLSLVLLVRLLAPVNLSLSFPYLMNRAYSTWGHYVRFAVELNQFHITTLLPYIDKLGKGNIAIALHWKCSQRLEIPIVADFIHSFLCWMWMCAQHLAQITHEYTGAKYMCGKVCRLPAHKYTNTYAHTHTNTDESENALIKRFSTCVLKCIHDRVTLTQLTLHKEFLGKSKPTAEVICFKQCKHDKW